MRNTLESLLAFALTAGLAIIGGATAQKVLELMLANPTAVKLTRLE